MQLGGRVVQAGGLSGRAWQGLEEIQSISILQVIQSQYVLGLGRGVA